MASPAKKVRKAKFASAEIFFSTETFARSRLDLGRGNGVRKRRRRDRKNVTELKRPRWRRRGQPNLYFT